jgi:hypothetical protein
MDLTFARTLNAQDGADWGDPTIVATLYVMSEPQTAYIDPDDPEGVALIYDKVVVSRSFNYGDRDENMFFAYPYTADSTITGIILAMGMHPNLTHFFNTNGWRAV